MGAKGDGSTVNCAALQKAIDDCPNIYLHKGNYLLSKPLVIKNISEAASKIINGEGVATTTLTRTNNTPDNTTANSAAPNRISITDVFNDDACIIINRSANNYAI